MKSIKVILTLFFVFSTILLSCDNEEEYICIGPYKPHFEIQGLNISNLKYFTSNYPYPWVRINESESVNWQSFFMRIEFKTEYHSLKQNVGSGGGNLYAFRCPINGDNGSKIGLDTLYVVTINDYNKNYKANDTINQITLFNNLNSRPSDYDTFIPLTQYIKRNSRQVWDEYFDIKFTEGPESTSTDKRFKIIYNLKNGAVFEAITKPVKLY